MSSEKATSRKSSPLRLQNGGGVLSSYKESNGSAHSGDTTEEEDNADTGQSESGPPSPQVSDGLSSFNDTVFVDGACTKHVAVAAAAVATAAGIAGKDGTSSRTRGSIGEANGQKIDKVQQPAELVNATNNHRGSRGSVSGDVFIELPEMETTGPSVDDLMMATAKSSPMEVRRIF